MKYIDADRLKEEIKKFSATEYNDGALGDDVANGALDYVLEKIIPSSQQEQPEVDLEKEIDKYVNTPENQGNPELKEELFKCALHFANIGWNNGYLKGRKDAHIPARELGLPKSYNFNKYDCPSTPIEEAVEVTSRMQHIDEELKPIANFIMRYAFWNLHKDECNQPVLEVPLFRVLDALVQRGKPYCES